MICGARFLRPVRRRRRQQRPTAVTSAVVARRRLAAATWSSCWYLLSAFAVISYTRSWIYVVFAAAGSWIGAYVSLTWLRFRDPPAHAPAPTSRA